MFNKIPSIKKVRNNNSFYKKSNYILSRELKLDEAVIRFWFNANTIVSPQFTFFNTSLNAS